MPWRREEVAPYHYEQVYIPDSTEQFYYSRIQRTPEEMERLYRRANGKAGGYADLPEDKPPEKVAPKEPPKKSLAKKANAEFAAPDNKAPDATVSKPKKVKPSKNYKL